MWSASLICPADAEGLRSLNIHLIQREDCEINPADAALQFMNCTRVTRLSLLEHYYWLRDSI